MSTLQSFAAEILVNLGMLPIIKYLKNILNILDIGG